jgi:hypothetical protein
MPRNHLQGFRHFQYIKTSLVILRTPVAYTGGRVDEEGWRILEQPKVDTIVNLSRNKDKILNWVPQTHMLWFPMGNEENPLVERFTTTVEETVRAFSSCSLSLLFSSQNSINW